MNDFRAVSRRRRSTLLPSVRSIIRGAHRWIATRALRKAGRR